MKETSCRSLSECNFVIHVRIRRMCLDRPWTFLDFSLFPSMRENQRYLLQYYTIGFCEFHLDKFICLFPLATWCDNILPENKENSVHSISSVGRETNLFVMIFIWFKHLRSTSGGFLFSCAFWNQDDLAKNIHVCNQIT